MPNTVNKYVCDLCNFKCSKMSNYKTHTLTQKHINMSFTNQKMQVNATAYQCNCGKQYKHLPSLYNHKKKCDHISNSIVHNNEIDSIPIVQPNDHDSVVQYPPDTAELIVMFKDMLAKMAEKDKQMADLQNTMKEMIPKIGNNNNNNNNKTFNLQMFLNTDCKDAINLTDFIKTIQLEMNDMLHIGNTGYVEGISDIFIGALNKLQITERPIHCTDVRRETVYIKEDNKWDKSNAENPVLRKAIHYIDKQNQHLLPKWMEENPDSQDLDTPENIQLMKMFANSLGQGEEQSKLNQKILKKILPRVALSKESAIQE